MKKLIKNTPFIGSFLKKAMGKKKYPYVFERIPAEQKQDNKQEETKLSNLLNYTKISGSSYSGKKFPAGYHTLEINGNIFKGQRYPKQRLSQINFDFRNKSVLDIGCNQGGMLFELSDRIKWGVGIDYDYRMINVSNRLKRFKNADNLDFYCFDLEKDDLEIIKDFFPENKVDIIFLFAVCKWIKSWKDVIKKSADMSDVMFFESNGNHEQQKKQEMELRKVFSNVEKLSDFSQDTHSLKERKLYYCCK